MIRRREDACVVHRPALIDFVERRAIGPDSSAALDHLARCGPCERDLTEVAQTVIALRRLGERASEVEIPHDGWPTLRERLERSQRAADDAARRFRRAFGGAVVAMVVVAMVAIPSLTGTVTSGLDEGVAVVPGDRPSTSEARRYDPFAQRLTEGIVLAIAGGGPARVSLVERVAGGPTSTDRGDPSHPATVVPTIPQLTAPRTALRT
jgi:predicted anti-sigma-YlaC factor YlaD